MTQARIAGGTPLTTHGGPGQVRRDDTAPHCPGLGFKTSTRGLPQPVDASTFTGESCSHFQRGWARAQWGCFVHTEFARVSDVGGLRRWADSRARASGKPPDTGSGPELQWPLASVRGITAVASSEGGSWQEPFTPHKENHCWEQGLWLQGLCPTTRPPQPHREGEPPATGLGDEWLAPADLLPRGRLRAF